MSELFPLAEIIKEEPPATPVPCRWPLFIVAYWPSGLRWKLFPETYEPNSPEMDRQIKLLKERGWSHIKICKLPV